MTVLTAASAAIAFARPGSRVRARASRKGALIGLLCVLLAGCASTYTERDPFWGGVAREVGRTVDR